MLRGILSVVGVNLLHCGLAKATDQMASEEPPTPGVSVANTSGAIRSCHRPYLPAGRSWVGVTA